MTHNMYLPNLKRTRPSTGNLDDLPPVFWAESETSVQNEPTCGRNYPEPAAFFGSSSSAFSSDLLAAAGASGAWSK